MVKLVSGVHKLLTAIRHGGTLAQALSDANMLMSNDNDDVGSFVTSLETVIEQVCEAQLCLLRQPGGI